MTGHILHTKFSFLSWLSINIIEFVCGWQLTMHPVTWIFSGYIECSECFLKNSVQNVVCAFNICLQQGWDTGSSSCPTFFIGGQVLSVIQPHLTSSVKLQRKNGEHAVSAFLIPPFFICSWGLNPSRNCKDSC